MLRVVLWSCLLGLSCADSLPLVRDHEPVVEDKEDEMEARELSSTQQKLEHYLRMHPQQRQLLADALLLSDAESALAADDASDALELLRNAFTLSDGEMQLHVLRRYLTVLADMQTERQSLSFYVKHVREQLAYRGEQESIAQHLHARLALPPDTFQPPSDFVALLHADPTLAVHARQYCRANTDRRRWQALLATFTAAVKTYWWGLTAACRGETAAALDFYQRYLAYAEGVESYPQFVLTATASIVAAGRKLVKSRAWLADAYRQLAAVWQRENYIEPQMLNVTEGVFLVRKTNDLLWAARYLALQADYEQAEVLARAALAAAKTGLRLAATSENFADLIAEAYHVLAFRIAVERKRYQQAIAHGNMALNYQLSPQWQQRLLWCNGLYYYLLHDWRGAIAEWQKILQRFPASSRQAQVLFWLARANQQLAEQSDTDTVAAQLHAQAESYLQRLAVEHPLSYYNLSVAEGDVWYTKHDVGGLQAALAAHRDIDSDSYRQHPVWGKTLQRAEIFIAAQVMSLAQVELRQLEKLLDTQSAAASDAGLRLYLSRLYRTAHNYLRGIIVTTKLVKQQPSYWQKHPEQLLIYYPRPYLAIYEQEACNAELDVSLLLAVTRQESAFNAAARGAAQEFGLMQLLPVTARRVAADNGIALSDFATQLLTPALNIKLGALYLHSRAQRYENNLVAMLAAYNAGEEAVDAWLQRRAHADPLVWIELIPFSSVSSYVKRVQRNLHVYRFLNRSTTLTQCCADCAA